MLYILFLHFRFPLRAAVLNIRHWLPMRHSVWTTKHYFYMRQVTMDVILHVLKFPFLLFFENYKVFFRVLLIIRSLFWNLWSTHRQYWEWMGSSARVISGLQNQHIYGTTRSSAVGFQCEVISFNSVEEI